MAGRTWTHHEQVACRQTKRAFPVKTGYCSVGICECSEQDECTAEIAYQLLCFLKTQLGPKPVRF